MVVLTGSFDCGPTEASEHELRSGGVYVGEAGLESTVTFRKSCGRVIGTLSAHSELAKMIPVQTAKTTLISDL